VNRYTRLGFVPIDPPPTRGNGGRATGDDFRRSRQWLDRALILSTFVTGRLVAKVIVLRTINA